MKTLLGFHAITSRLRQKPDTISEIYVDATRADGRAKDLRKMAEAAGVRVNLEQSKIDFVIAEQKQAPGPGQDAGRSAAHPRDQDKKMKKIDTRCSDGGRKGKKR